MVIKCIRELPDGYLSTKVSRETRSQLRQVRIFYSMPLTEDDLKARRWPHYERGTFRRLGHLRWVSCLIL